jgi:hypothetical protein
LKDPGKGAHICRALMEIALSNLDRRTVLHILGSALPLAAIARSGAIAGGNPRALDRWAQNVADLNAALRDGNVSNLDWQARMGALNADVDLAELSRYLDFDQLTRSLQISSDLAETADPKFPSHINIGGKPRRWFLRFFGMRRGGAIIPHVHNNMVSAHLIMSGSFRVRTFDRVADEPGDLAAVQLRRRANEVMGPGRSITMSDDSHNGHWLVSKADRSFTFDTGVIAANPARAHALKAGEYNMIFVDAGVGDQSADVFRAPVMTFEESRAKYAAG